MILEASKSTIAYRCPCCGANVVSIVGIFSLSGDMIRLKCSCGGSALTITRAEGDKLRLDIPCILCTKPHNFVISPSVFFNKNIFAFSCTYSGMDIAFVGREDAVKEALEQSDREFLSLLADAGFSSFEEYSNSMQRYETERSAIDPQVEDVVRFMLYELADDGAIHCGCKNPENSSYGFEIKPDEVVVSCDDCGYSVSIPIEDVISANAFLSIDELYLNCPPPEGWEPEDDFDDEE